MDVGDGCSDFSRTNSLISDLFWCERRIGRLGWDVNRTGCRCSDDEFIQRELVSFVMLVRADDSFFRLLVSLTLFTNTASLTDDFKIFDVHEISSSGFSKDRLNPCTDFHLGLIFNIDKVLERIITAIKLYKAIPIRDRFCDSCLRIDE